MSLKKRFLRAFIVYSLDMGVAILGWIYGFGLHVANWWALIGIMIVWRFVFHMLTTIFAYQDSDAIKGGQSK